VLKVYKEDCQYCHSECTVQACIWCIGPCSQWVQHLAKPTSKYQYAFCNFSELLVHCTTPHQQTISPVSLTKTGFWSQDSHNCWLFLSLVYKLYQNLANCTLTVNSLTWIRDKGRIRLASGQSWQNRWLSALLLFKSTSSKYCTFYVSMLCFVLLLLRY